MAKEHKAKQVASGKKKEVTFLDKFVTTFFEEDLDAVLEHIKKDVVIPYAKEITANIVTDSINMALYGDSRSTRSSSGRRSYNPSYESAYNSRNRTSHRTESRHRKSIYIPIIVETRDDLLDVKDELESMLEEYGTISVADIYDTVDAKTEPTDNDWGWDSLRGFQAKILPDGRYEIRMPRPIAIN